MELQQGLNNVIRERVAKRIQTGSMNAQEAVQKLISEGKVANDYIAYLGANNTRKSEVLFNAKDAVEMQLGNDGVYTIHDNAIGQLGERFNIPSKYLRELSGGNEWQSTGYYSTQQRARTTQTKRFTGDSRRFNEPGKVINFLGVAIRL